MSTQAVVVQGVVKPDGTLELQDKVGLPAGPVQVVVLRAARSQDLEDRFRQLAAEWRRDVGPLSSVSKIVQHPAYQAIIALGRDAVPLILQDLERQPDHWFAALRAITGAEPIPPEDRGRMDRMAAAWVRWGKEHGFTWRADRGRLSGPAGQGVASLQPRRDAVQLHRLGGGGHHPVVVAARPRRGLLLARQLSHSLSTMWVWTSAGITRRGPFFRVTFSGIFRG
jgi:hypothetical protein